MRNFFCDFETRSTVDIKKRGAHVYAADPSTEVMCMAYAYDDEPIQLWTPFDFPFVPITSFEDVTVWAHNAAFELAIWNQVCVKKYGFPQLPLERTQCTMALSYAMALPGSLEGAAAAMGITAQKDMAGHRLMLQLSQPRSIHSEGKGGCVWWEDEEKFQKLYAYCMQDIEVERQLYARLVQLSPYEQEVWRLDQTINNRGVFVDLDLVKAAIQMVAAEKVRLDLEMREVSGGAVATCTATGQLTDWLRWNGIETKGVAKNDVLEMLEHDIAPQCRQALLLRQEAAKSSNAKLDSMVLSAGNDSRIRGLFQYSAASTRRFGGRRIQPQNLPRPLLSSESIDGVFDILRKVKSIPEARDIVELCYGRPLQAISDCIRGFLTAAPGHDLICGDWSAIEARILAWLAGEETVLNAFRTRGKIYEQEASGIYGVPMSQIDKDQRQIGKVATLALGYQGGVGAFQSMAKNYNVKVSDKRADEIKIAWRNCHPAIVSYWYAVERAAKNAILNVGDKFTAGHKGREVTFRVRGSFLWCRLPGGGVICYPYPKIKKKPTPWHEIRDVIGYMGVDATTYKFESATAYGGMLVENITQAVARNILVDAMLRLDQAGYKIVLHVHDEVVVEVPSHYSDLHLASVLSFMKQLPEWAKDLPLDAEGWRGKRYRK